MTCAHIVVPSCLFVLFRSLPNGIYKLENNNSLEEYEAYCHMTEISGCGGGGWTLVMKLDGNKVKGNYASLTFRTEWRCYYEY